MSHQFKTFEEILEKSLQKYSLRFEKRIGPKGRKISLLVVIFNPASKIDVLSTADIKFSRKGLSRE